MLSANTTSYVLHLCTPLDHNENENRQEKSILNDREMSKKKKHTDFSSLIVDFLLLIVNLYSMWDKPLAETDSFFSQPFTLSNHIIVIYFSQQERVRGKANCL